MAHIPEDIAHRQNGCVRQQCKFVNNTGLSSSSERVSYNLGSFLYTVKSQIESATLFKIRHFWRDSNRVRTLSEWGLYFFA